MININNNENELNIQTPNHNKSLEYYEWKNTILVKAKEMVI